jgi:hypothetical protein
MDAPPPFWEFRWLFGAAPKEMVPSLFALTRFKRRSVQQELSNSNWIRNLGTIDNPSMVEEYVMLYLAISAISLTDRRDQIFWRWSGNGKFSVAYAYNCHLIGSLNQFLAQEIWRARTEPKCRFFASLDLQDRALTADNLAKKDLPCNLTCPLCFCQQESAAHLLT